MLTRETKLMTGVAEQPLLGDAAAHQMACPANAVNSGRV